MEKKSIDWDEYRKEQNNADFNPGFADRVMERLQAEAGYISDDSGTEIYKSNPANMVECEFRKQN